MEELSAIISFFFLSQEIKSEKMLEGMESLAWKSKVLGKQQTVMSLTEGERINNGSATGHCFWKQDI